jgi:hypothetical protein
MTWRSKVKVRKREELPPIWHPEPGEYRIEILEEPEGPTATRHGERLVFLIRELSSGNRFRWFLPYRDEVSEESVLGQLAKIANEYGKLEGKRLKVVVTGRGSTRRYSIEVLR